MDDSLIHTQQATLDIRKSIKFSVIQTAFYASGLKSWLNTPRGPRHVQFDPFFKSFDTLFRLTAPRRAIRQNKDYGKVAGEIRAWFGKRDYDTEELQQGLDLLDRWFEVIEDAGLIETGAV